MAKVLEREIQVLPNGDKYVTFELEPGIACKAMMTPTSKKPILGDPFTDRVDESRKSLLRSDVVPGAYKAVYAAAYVVFIKLGFVPDNLMLYPPVKKAKKVDPNQLVLPIKASEWMPCTCCKTNLVWVAGGYDTCSECEAKQ